MNEVGECPRCKLIMQEQADGLSDTGEGRSVLDQVDYLLAGLDMLAEGQTVNSQPGDRLFGVGKEIDEGGECAQWGQKSPGDLHRRQRTC
jgi:hypothetical protein